MQCGTLDTAMTLVSVGLSLDGPDKYKMAMMSAEVWSRHWSINGELKTCLMLLLYIYSDLLS